MGRFLGTYEHSLDDKGRVTMPAKFRALLTEGGYVTKSLDGCLALYTEEEFDRVAAELQDQQRRGSLARNAVRTFAAGAAEASLDKQGRISIPANLRDYAGLDREVVVTGAISRVEIWNADAWRRIDSESDRNLVTPGAELDDIGL